MPRLKLHTAVLVIGLRLCSTVIAQNLTNQITNLANDFASFKKEMTGNVKDINSGIKSMEDRLKTNTDLSMFSTLNQILAARNAQTSNSKQSPVLDVEVGAWGPRGKPPQVVTTTAPQQTTTTTASPAGSSVASDFMRFQLMGWLKAFADSQASQLGLPSRWLGPFGDLYPTAPSGFPNMRWLGAFGGDMPRLQQKPQEIVDYPVIIIPESSFYQIGQPLPRPYPIYPPSGYDQYAAPPPTYSTYARPP